MKSRKWRYPGALPAVKPESKKKKKKANKKKRVIVVFCREWVYEEDLRYKKPKESHWYIRSVFTIFLQFNLSTQTARSYLRPYDPTRVMASSFLRFLDHTQRRTTVGKAALDEWSARHRDLYLTTHSTHNRHTSMPRLEFEPTISADEWPQTYALDRAATGTGNCMVCTRQFPTYF
jgi:hypothetical protein